MEEKIVRYNRDTKLFGLVGYPLGHSVVPTVYNAIYRYGQINALMVPMELEDAEGNLDRFFEAVRTLKIGGFLVTMPYKTRILPYMDEASEICKAFNCVNAVKYENGKLYGQALDGYGMCETIEEAGISLAGREALIVGAGGISGVVAAEMASRGVTGFTILNRTPEHAKHIAEMVEAYSGKPVHAGALTPEELDRAAQRAGVVAQCTSVGMQGMGTSFSYLGFMEKLDPSAVVVDALYNPPQTAFLKAAADCGLRTFNGMGMLSNQLNALMQFFFQRDLGQEGKQEVIRIVETVIGKA